MVNPFKEVSWAPTTAELRTFGKSLVVGFPILAVIFLLLIRWRTGEWNASFPGQLAAYGAGAGVVFWLIPQIARPFYVVWYALACCIGLIVGNLLLGLVFYVLVGGIGLCMRLLGRDALQLKKNPGVQSYWKDVKETKDPKQYFRQF